MMIDAQILLSASESTDPMKLPAFKCALTYMTREPIASFGCSVARNRSDLAGQFMAGDCDVGVCLDPDVDFTERLVSLVVDRARETKGVAGGTYSHPELKYNVVPLGGHTLKAGSTPTQRVRLGPGSPDGPLSVDAVPTGLMAIHRDVFEAIYNFFPLLRTPGDTAPAYWFRERRLPIDGGSFFLSSDYSFCSYARDVGSKVELIPSAVAGHKGKPWWAPLGREPVGGYVEVDIGDAGVSLRDLNAGLVP